MSPIILKVVGAVSVSLLLACVLTQIIIPILTRRSWFPMCRPQRTLQQQLSAKEQELAELELKLQLAQKQAEVAERRAKVAQAENKPNNKRQ